MIFNGSYTIKNERTGEHRTFLVKTQKEDARFAAGERVAALLTGPNNESDYQGFAFVKGDGVVVWKKKRGDRQNPTSFDWFADMLNVKVLGQLSRFGKSYEEYSCQCEKRCLRCNRKLTHPESLLSGFGPECEGRAKGSSSKKA